MPARWRAEVGGVNLWGGRGLETDRYPTQRFFDGSGKGLAMALTERKRKFAEALLLARVSGRFDYVEIRRQGRRRFMGDKVRHRLLLATPKVWRRLRPNPPCLRHAASINHFFYVGLVDG